MFSSPNRRREQRKFSKPTKNKDEREKSTYRRCAPIRQGDVGDADGDFRAGHLGVQGRAGDELHQSNQRQEGGE